jgi:hypothetical protein
VAGGLRALAPLKGLALLAVAGPGEPAPGGGFDFLFRGHVDLDDLRRLLVCLRPGEASPGKEAG